MRSRIVLLAAAIALAVPGQVAAQRAGALAESVKPGSSVSLLVEPKLADGRLVLKIAAKNLGNAPARFGPSAISIAKPTGEAVALYPLQSLIDDVRVAAGMAAEGASAGAPTQGAYAAPQMQVREGGQLDVTGYTGGATVGGDEYLRRSRVKRAKPTISEAEAQSQIAALRQAILQDTTMAPGQVVAAQVVSDKLKFAKREERILHVRIRIAGDEHAFTIAAPSG